MSADGKPSPCGTPAMAVASKAAPCHAVRPSLIAFALVAVVPAARRNRNAPCQIA